MSKSPEQMREMPEEGKGNKEQGGENPSEDEKRFDHTRKTIEVAPGIKVISTASVTELESGKESGRDYLYLVTKNRKELVDSSDYFIDLQSATQEENEVVITYTKQEKHYPLKRGVYDESYSYHEEVTESKQYEKRIPLH